MRYSVNDYKLIKHLTDVLVVFKYWLLLWHLSIAKRRTCAEERHEHVVSRVLLLFLVS